MEKFIFDNIMIIALIAYAVVIVLSKMFINKENDEEIIVQKPEIRRAKEPLKPRKRVAPQPQKESYDYSPIWSESTVKPIPTENEEDYLNVFGQQKNTAIPPAQSNFELDYEALLEEIEKDAKLNNLHSTNSTQENIIPQKQKEFSNIFSDNNSLRRAFVASEILGKPKSMRRDNIGIL